MPTKTGQKAAGPSLFRRGEESSLVQGGRPTRPIRRVGKSAAWPPPSSSCCDVRRGHGAMRLLPTPTNYELAIWRVARMIEATSGDPRGRAFGLSRATALTRNFTPNRSSRRHATVQRRISPSNWRSNSAGSVAALVDGDRRSFQVTCCGIVQSMTGSVHDATRSCPP